MDKIETLDALVSRYVRLRDSKPFGFKSFCCISCGRVLPFEQMDCGHFVKRSNMATRFDEQNCHGQCVRCNRFEQGRYEDYRRNLERRIGAEAVEDLIRRGHQTVKFSRSDLDDMIKTYKEKIKELENGD